MATPEQRAVELGNYLRQSRELFVSAWPETPLSERDVARSKRCINDALSQRIAKWKEVRNKEDVRIPCGNERMAFRADAMRNIAQSFEEAVLQDNLILVTVTPATTCTDREPFRLAVTTQRVVRIDFAQDYYMLPLSKLANSIEQTIVLGYFYNHSLTASGHERSTSGIPIHKGYVLDTRTFGLNRHNK